MELNRKEYLEDLNGEKREDFLLEEKIIEVEQMERELDKDETIAVLRNHNEALQSDIVDAELVLELARRQIKSYEDLLIHMFYFANKEKRLARKRKSVRDDFWYDNAARNYLHTLRKWRAYKPQLRFKKANCYESEVKYIWEQNHA